MDLKALTIYDLLLMIETLPPGLCRRGRVKNAHT